MSEFPLDDSAAVERYIRFFTTNDREDFLNHLKIGGRYRAMVDRIFQQEGIPPELFYVADLESGFNIYSTNPSGARGMWQFVGGRATDYGLVHTAWVDERQDPEKSTIAAARYLHYLYTEFGDWYLAVSAYVAGPITIQRAVSLTGSADFWDLTRAGALSRNTRDYIPVLIAMATVAEHPDQYGLQVAEDAPEDYATVHLTNATSLQLAADCAGTSLTRLRRLNPSLLHPRAPAGFDLHVPVGGASRFAAALSLVPPERRLTWRVHRLQSGESLPVVARRYDVSLQRLEAANALYGGISPDPGQLLLIPAAEPAARAGTPPPPAWADASGLVHYRVRSGDTWASVARHFGVTSTELRAWNPNGKQALHAGLVLTIRRNAALAAAIKH